MKIIKHFIFAFCFLSGCTAQPPDSIGPHATREYSQDIFYVGLFDTRLNSYWSSIPTIKVCPGTGITPSRIRSALSFWEAAGYQFGPTIYATPSMFPCEANPGQIAFKIPTQSELSAAVESNRLGVTLTSYDRVTRQIIMADIFFQHQFASHKQKIVEHEIGHALGWAHHNRDSHIMHPTLDQTGYSKIGVERRDYENKIVELLGPLGREGNEE